MSLSAAVACSLALFLSAPSRGTAGFGAGPSIDDPLVGRIERPNLERIVAKLSGADTVVFGEESVHIVTRYANSPAMPRVREYLVREIRAAGYEPELRRFVLRVDAPDLTGSALSPGGDTLWVADTDGAIYRSASAIDAARFERIGFVDASVFALERDPVNRLWACGRLPGSAYGGLFVSADGGDTWSLRYSGAQTYSLGTIAFANEQFCMAGGSGGSILRSADGGGTWSPLDPAALGYEGISGSTATGPLRFWLVSDFGSVFDTRDFGGTWRSRHLVLGRLAAIDFFGERTGVIVGSRLVFYTRDAGENWTRVDVPAELTSVDMVDSLRVFAAGGGGEIWISGDGGATWERFGAECGVTQDVWSVAAAGRDTLWLTGRDVVRRIVDDGDLRSCEAYALADTVWSVNIVFRREGEVDPARRVLLGAHYDSYSGTDPLQCAPGADDNATGTAAVIECARVLRSERLARTVEFVLFDAEEVGIIGSRRFAAALDSQAVYEGMLNIDMIGWEPNAEMTAVIAGRVGDPGDSAIAGALAAAIDSFDLGIAVAYLAGEPLTSDHMAFWEVDIPAVLLIEGTRVELTPYYHSCADGATTINYAFHETCTKAALGAVAILAGHMPPQTPPDPAPSAVALRQNYPNPFNMGTIIRYEIPAPSFVEIEVFDAAGRRVAVVDRGAKPAGENACRWDGRDERGALVRSGVYFLRLRTPAGEASRKMIVAR